MQKIIHTSVVYEMCRQHNNELAEIWDEYLLVNGCSYPTQKVRVKHSYDISLLLSPVIWWILESNGHRGDILTGNSSPEILKFWTVRSRLLSLAWRSSVHPRCLLCCMTEWTTKSSVQTSQGDLETSSLSHVGNFLVFILLLSFVYLVRIIYIFWRGFSSPFLLG